MRFVLVLSLSSLTITVAQDFFSPDPAWDDFSLSWDNLDGTDNLEDSDPSFLASASSDSEQELSSCVGEESDLLSWSKVRVRVRARDGKSSCSTLDRPTPFKDDLPNRTKDPVENLKDIFGLLPNEEDDEEEEMPNFAPLLIDDTKCLPMFPHNLCCQMRESFTTEIYAGAEVSYYHRCLKRLSFYCA